MDQPKQPGKPKRLSRFKPLARRTCNKTQGMWLTFRKVMGRPKRSIFKFFGLPPELRLEIYDILTVQKRDLPHFRRVRITNSVANAQVKHVRLISRQFTKEYDDHTHKSACLILTDNDNFRFGRITLPKSMTFITKLELQLLLIQEACIHTPSDTETCNALVEVGHHNTWIRSLLRQARCLKDVSVKFYLTPIGGRGCEADVVDACAKWAEKLKTVRNVEFYRCNFIDTGPKVLRASWSRETGVVSAEG